MAVIRDLLARLRLLFRRDPLADEIREELEFHRDARVAQYEREGLSPAAAARTARRRIGPMAVHQADGYRIRGGTVLESIAQDIRYGVRVLRRQPGFSAVAILTLALGIGASTAIVSVIDAAYLHPLPYPNPEQLVEISIEVDSGQGDRRYRLAPSEADRQAWLGSETLSAIGAAGLSRPVFIDGPAPERLSFREISDGYLEVHGVQPVLGRAFELADLRAGAEPVLLVSHAYWQQQLGGRADVLGQRLVSNGRPSTIVGVLPGHFHPDTPIWRPKAEPDAGRRGGGSGRQVVARLGEDVSPETAAAELTRLTLATPELAVDNPRVLVRRLLDDAGAGALPTLQILGGAVLLMLFLGCINVAGLLLARSATREAELATRAAIGAGRGRLVRQLLVESALLASVGGAAGVLLATLTLDLLVANIPIRLPDNVMPSVNPRVLGFAAAATVVTSLLFGLAPAIRLSGVRLASAAAGLRDRGRALSRRGGSVLIAAEVALGIVLLAGAGLMLRSFERTLGIDIGFDPSRFVTVEVRPVDGSPGVQDAYYADLIAALQNQPGVEAAGATDTMPLTGGLIKVFARGPDDGTSPLVPREIVPGYVEAIGLRLVEGRPLTAGDRTAGAVTGALINETAARRLFPDGSAVGRTVTFGVSPPPGSPYEPARPQVVGVVGDVRHGGPFSRILDEIYVPFRTTSSGLALEQGLTVVVRPTERNPVTAEVIRDVARSIGPRVVVGAIRSGSEWYGATITTPRQRTVLLSLLGGLGLVLALVGIFGMTAYAVARRTREIGVRMAFGARPDHLVWRMVADAARPIAVGTVLGLGAAALTTRVIESFLFETTPTDPITFAAVATVLATSGLIAAWIPARRAARVDPVAALRAE